LNALYAIYIFIFIYICLLHYVANEEKFFIRYNGGEKEWEFALDFNTEGGLELYSRLKENKKIKLTFELEYESEIIIREYDANFPSLIKIIPIGLVDYKVGDMLAGMDMFIIGTGASENSFPNFERIGHLIQTDGFSMDDINYLIGDSANDITLEFILESDGIETPGISDATKITVINKKIMRVIIFLFLLFLLIILFIIIKFICLK